MGVGGQRHAQPDFTPRKAPAPIVQEAGWASGSVWIEAENLAPHRDSIPVATALSGPPFTRSNRWKYGRSEYNVVENNTFYILLLQFYSEYEY